MEGPRFALVWADYVIFVVIICISLGIGIYHALSGSRQRTTAEYLVGNRKMSYLPVSLSYTATFMSSIFFLGTPAEMYAHGVQYLLAFYATILANILAAIFTVPLFHHLKITSAYEYLEFRFNSVAVRRMGSCFGILTNTLYMAVVLFGPAVALKAVAGFPLWTSVLVIGLSSVIYTAIGGIKAVVWTDVFQSSIMVLGLIAIVVKSMYDIGGLQRFWNFNLRGQRFDISFDLDPTIARTFWTCLFGGTAKWFSFAINQSSVLRYVSIPSLSDARKMILWSTPTFLVLATAAALEGFCAFAFYSNKRCDPFQEGVITNSNQILPYFVMELFHTTPGPPALFLASLFSVLQILPYFLMELFHTTPGLPGLFLASLFSASLSTLSSGLSSISACTLTDFVRPAFPRMTEIRATVVAKLIVVVFGCIAVGLSFLIMQISGTVTQIAFGLLGAVDGPTCSMFLLGGLVPFANKYGALSGGIVGIGISLWISVGASFSGPKTPWLPPAPTDGCLANFSGSTLSGSYSFPPNTSTHSSADWLNASDVTQSAPIAEQPGLAKLYSLSFMHVTFLGMIVTFVVGVIVSVITGPTKPSSVNPAYISYLVRRCFYSKDRLDDLEKELQHLREVDTNFYIQRKLTEDDMEMWEVNNLLTTHK